MTDLDMIKFKIVGLGLFYNFQAQQFDRQYLGFSIMAMFIHNNL
jgi:hypothetical protein